MVIHKLQFLFTKSTVTLYRQWEIEQKQPVQMADTKTNETRNREVNSLYLAFFQLQINYTNGLTRCPK